MAHEDAPVDPGTAGGPVRYSSLGDALRAHRIPDDNHALIRQAVDRLDVVAFEGTGSYVKALRSDGGPALQIAYGYTNGFRSEAEVLATVGDVERWPSGRGSALWGITHPVHQLRDGGGSRGARDTRPEPVCPSCGSVLPLTGTCDFCD